MHPAIKKFIQKIEPPRWLLVLLSACFLLRIPSFFEPYYYGDEMIYLTLGQGIRQHIPLYLRLHDNKPPLIYIIAKIAGNLFWFKVILAFWSFATIVIFWHLAKKIFPKKERVAKAATIVFAILTTIPLIEGNIANAELFFIGPIMGGFLILLSKKLTAKNLFLSGILFSLATLFKIPAFFDIFAIVLLWIFFTAFKVKEIKRLVVNFFWLFLGFTVPILFTLIWYFWRGALKEYLIAAFLQNLGYLSSWSGQVAYKTSFLLRNRSLFIRTLIVALGSSLLFVKRKKLPKEFIFICLWLLFSLFAVTLSERPYPHYLIQAAAPISLLLGLLFYDKTLLQVFAIIPLTLAFFVPVYFRFWIYPTFSYYQRFVNFAAGRLTKEQYFSTFRKAINRNYEIAKMITTMTNTKDKVFVWGDDSSIYALSKRLPPIKYVADYHIRDFSSQKEIMNALLTNPPKMIVYLPEGRAFPALKLYLKEKYILLADIEGAEVYKIIDAGRPLLK
jgi:4-amino-4-deoxy-L-arabinose transferase-like glycosyltransferase